MLWGDGIEQTVTPKEDLNLNIKLVLRAVAGSGLPQCGLSDLPFDVQLEYSNSNQRGKNVLCTRFLLIRGVKA